MDLQNCPLEHAVLHEPTFLPGRDGRGVNLKNTLSISSVEGKSMKLKMTLMGSFILIETSTTTGLLPVSNFKLCVPSKQE